MFFLLQYSREEKQKYTSLNRPHKMSGDKTFIRLKSSQCNSLLRVKFFQVC